MKKSYTVSFSEEEFDTLLSMLDPLYDEERDLFARLVRIEKDDDE